MFIARLSLVLVSLATVGCASARPATLVDRFVRQGTPTVDMGGPRPQASMRTSSAALPRAIERVPWRLASGGGAIESRDPALRDALARLALAPTVAHHLQVARAYRRLGIHDAAFDHLTRSLAVNGPDPSVHDALARLWRDWGQPGTGLSHAHQAVYLAPRWATGHNTLGTLLFALGQRGEARRAFEAAAALAPEAAYAQQNLCVAYQAEGRTREAIAACRRAAALSRRPAPKEHR